MRRTAEQKLMYYTNQNFYEKMLYQLMETEEKVAWILAHDEHARNCDKCLIMKFIGEEAQDHFVSNKSPQEIIHACSSGYDIVRARQIIQHNLKLFPPTDSNVIEKRRVKESACKEFYLKEGTNESNQR